MNSQLDGLMCQKIVVKVINQTANKKIKKHMKRKRKIERKTKIYHHISIFFYSSFDINIPACSSSATPSFSAFARILCSKSRVLCPLTSLCSGSEGGCQCVRPAISTSEARPGCQREGTRLRATAAPDGVSG